MDEDTLGPELVVVVPDSVAVVIDLSVVTVPLEMAELVQMYLVEVHFKGGAE